MKVLERIADVRQHVSESRAAGRSVGLVPTMGALHEGHLSLIDAAIGPCDEVVVSLFVNPTQFGPGEDLESYPRTPEADHAACEAHGVDVAFAPSVEEMYDGGSLTEVHVHQLTDKLCGASRPGHFDGVCTVVLKLLNIVTPDRVYFGQKDFQQSVVVRRMVADLNVPTHVVTCPIVREADGLAMSSRNAYLDERQRPQAPALYQALQLGREMIVQQAPPPAEVIAAMERHLASAAPDGRIDYLRIVNPATLEDVSETTPPVLIAAAFQLGSARLIDNILIES